MRNNFNRLFVVTVVIIIGFVQPRESIGERGGDDGLFHKKKGQVEDY